MIPTCVMVSRATSHNQGFSSCVHMVYEFKLDKQMVARTTVQAASSICHHGIPEGRSAIQPTSILEIEQ